MPDEKAGISRRNLFDTMAAGSLVFAAAKAAGAAPAPEEPKIEPIANFKYNIESREGWQGPGGSAKEATVAEFPISQSIAGVSMRLKPGAIRELHWHALAAEWAYMLEGRCRATVVMPNGQSEIADFGPGDTWYFPRGHGHALQGMGPGECHFILGFDNGHFSEYGTFSITDWIATAPKNVVARTLAHSRIRRRAIPEKGSLHRPRQGARRRHRASPRWRWTDSAVLAQVPPRHAAAARISRADASSSSPPKSSPSRPR